jgi:hypothetical protein
MMHPPFKESKTDFSNLKWDSIFSLKILIDRRSGKQERLMVILGAIQTILYVTLVSFGDIVMNPPPPLCDVTNINNNNFYFHHTQDFKYIRITVQ